MIYYSTGIILPVLPVRSYCNSCDVVNFIVSYVNYYTIILFTSLCINIEQSFTISK